MLLSWDFLFTVLEQVDRGKTLIIASHILSEVEKICSHLAILKQGDLLVAGSVKELLAEEELIEFSSSDNETLLKKLNESKLTREIEKKNGVLSAILSQSVTSADINSFAFKNKITLTHLVSKKKSLETQFLELVKE